MKWIAIIIACLMAHTSPLAQEVIAADTLGMVVQIREKYGPTLTDTCTVLMYHAGQFVLVKKDGLSGWFPASFHSVRVMEKLSDRHGTETSDR